MLVLADTQNALIDIILPLKSDRVVRFAAQELVSYLNKISGAEFLIKEKELPETANEAKGLLLIPRENNVERPALEALAKADNDTYKIYSTDSGCSISGNNGRSVLYGVYELLETLGCRFIEPGIETIPSYQKLELATTQKESTADFNLRNVFRIQILKSKTAEFQGLEPEHHLPQIDWMAKQRLNHYIFYVDYYRYDLWEKYKHNVLDALLDRGFRIEVTHHSISYFCPPNVDSDFGDFGPETYQQNHPDWYIEGQVRVEIPEVQKIITERLLAYYRNNPEVSIVGLWPGDSAMNKPYPELSHTDGYIKFWNIISEAVKTEFPDKKLCTLAYFEITAPPDKVKPNENLHNWFCRHDDNYMYPITDEHNKQYYDYLKGWLKEQDPQHIACFHYYGWMPILTPFPENMKKDLAVYKEMNLAGVYGWSGFTFNIMGTDYRWARDLYVFSRLLWNSNHDLQSLEEIWAEGVFDTAAPGILDFYKILRNAHKEESQKGLLAKEPWISLELLHKLQKALAHARQKAETPEILHRINLLEQVAAAGSTAVINRKPINGIQKAF